MNTNFKTSELVRAGLFVALGIVLPMAFHAFQMGGPVFLPMHIPVLLAGFFLSPLLAFLVGILTPLLSSVLTSMPPIFPMAIIMMFELGTYGLVVSLVVRRNLFRNSTLSHFFTLLCAMVAGRVVAGLVVYIMTFTVTDFKMSPIPFVAGGIVKGLPGIIIQLIFIPLLLFFLSKAKLYKNNN